MAESLPSPDDIQEAAEEYYFCHLLMEMEKELKKSSEAELYNQLS